MTSTTRQTNKNNKKQCQTVDLDVCALCLSSEDDVEQYGKFFRCSVQELAVHEYCLFFASGLAQNGEEKEGFDGFLFQDIRHEIKRASKLRCSGCRKKGAAVGCCVLKCGSAFHFTCGLKQHALFQFFDSFCSFCKRHRPTQDTLVSHSESTQTPTCPICLSDVDISDTFATLKSPCCKNAWFHRSCIQKQALANGMYFFRCAFCNNFDEFQKEMKRMGIYIPDRDAIWEQGDAYVELLHQHNRCDAPNCVCPRGREYSGKHKGQRWKIYKCFACGQSGTHRWCQQPEIRRRFFCQNCVVCFPQQEQAKNNSLLSSASEYSSIDDSQSILDASQNSDEITKDMNTSTEDIPLRLLKTKIGKNKDGCSFDACKNRLLDNTQCTTSLSQSRETAQELNNSLTDDTPLSLRLKTKTDTGINKNDCNSCNTASETATLSLESVFSCTNKEAMCHLDDYTTMVSTDDSNSVDVENLSTDSSCISSIYSGIISLNIDEPKVKPKKKKRKAVTNQCKGVRQSDTSYLKAKAQRQAKREEPKKKIQQGKQPRIKRTKRNQAKMSIESVTKDDASSSKNPNDLFSLQLSPESDILGQNLKTKSPNQKEKIPLHSMDEDCIDTCTFEENPASDVRTAKYKTGSTIEGELQIEDASISSTSSPSKTRDGSEMSISSGTKKLLQRDIRSMLAPPHNSSTSLSKSPAKLVEEHGCQTEPLKLRRANKRRKLSTSLSECQSITSFMSVNDSPTKRKNLHHTSLNSLLPNDKTETASSTSSHSLIETMTAAKGMVMRALKRLSGSSLDTSTPKKSPIKDIDCDSNESWKSGPSEVRDQVDVDLAPCRTTRESVEDSDSDSSDSIKVVEVRKGRGPRKIPVVTGKIPSHIHEKFCACYKMHGRKVPMPNRPKNPADPNEVIVIDDEDDQDEQDSGKGSSRDTSDAGTKSVDGSGLEDKKTPCNDDDDDESDCCYSSCGELSFDDDDRANSQQPKLKLDSSANDINSQSVARHANTSSPLQSVDSKEHKRTKRDSSKSFKQSKTTGNDKKRAEYRKNLCRSSNPDNLTAVVSKESFGNSHFTEKHVDGEDIFESLDCLVDECTENNSKGKFKKKGKSHSSKKAGAHEHSQLSPLSQKSKANLSNMKYTSQELGEKKFLSLKKYMECSDEDFQSKKKLSSRSKGIKATKSSNKDKDQTNKRKRKKSGTIENFSNSISCTSTASTVTSNTL